MLDRAHIKLSPRVAPAPPVEQFVLGRSVEDAAELLPRIFNLCRAAQMVAARLSFGLALPNGWKQDLCRDIARDHALKLAVMLPAKLGMAPLVLPPGNQHLSKPTLGAIFPKSGAAFEDYLKTEQGIAPYLRAVDQIFAPGEAVTDTLPTVTAVSAERIAPVENSLAARHLDHPVLQYLEVTRGRGPLWRLAARALDLQAVEQGALADPLVVNGAVLVPAARGLYAVRAEVQAGRVTAFRRFTPTDHMLAPGGILAQSLARLPAEKHPHAPLLLDILDPCVPVSLQEGAQDA